MFSFLGYIENPEEEKWESHGVINKTRAYAMLDRYKTDADVEKAFAELNGLLEGAAFQVHREVLQR